MEQQLLDRVRKGIELSSVVSDVKNHLNPVLDEKIRIKLKEQAVKKHVYFLSRLLRDCHDAYKDQDVYIELFLLGCDGIQSIGFDHFDDRTLIAKIMHLMFVKLIKENTTINYALTLSEHLLQILMFMDRVGNLPDMNEKDRLPLATNTYTYLWNAAIMIQKKSGAKEAIYSDHFSLFSKALCLNTLTVPSHRILDRIMNILGRDFHKCDQSYQHAVSDMILEILQVFYTKYGYEKDENIGKCLCDLATLCVCFLINNDLMDKCSAVFTKMENLSLSSECLKLLEKCQNSESISDIDLTALDMNAETEWDKLCLTETIHSIIKVFEIHKKAKRDLVEKAFLKHGGEECKTVLNQMEPANKKAVISVFDSKQRAVILSANLFTLYKKRLDQFLCEMSLDNIPEYEKEIKEYKAIVVHCMKSNLSHAGKKLHDIGTLSLKFAQALKRKNKLHECLSFYEIAISSLFQWTSNSKQPKSDLSSVHHEYCWILIATENTELAITEMEKFVVDIDDKRDLDDHVELYVKAKKKANRLSEDRYLADSMQSGSHQMKVYQSELEALYKQRLNIVGAAQFRLVEKLLQISNHEPAQYGCVLIAKAQVLWSTKRYSEALEAINESRTILESVESIDSTITCDMARMYLWLYVCMKANQLNELNATHTTTGVTEEVEPPHESMEPETDQNDLLLSKSEQIFTLYDEHELNRNLDKSLNMWEKTTDFSSQAEHERDLNILYDILSLNDDTESCARLIRIAKKFKIELDEVDNLSKRSELSEAMNILSSRKDQTSLNYLLSSARLDYLSGNVKHGYETMVSLSKSPSKLVPNLGGFASLMAEYRLLPLEVLGVSEPDCIADEYQCPVYCVSLASQWCSNALAKEASIETGILKGAVDEKGPSYIKLLRQWKALEQMMTIFLIAARVHSHVGQIKHAKTCLHEAMVLAKRYGLPKWIAKILTESAKLSLLEGRVQLAEKHLCQAFHVLNNGFVDGSGEPMKENVDSPEVEIYCPENVATTPQPREQARRANVLMNSFGFDSDAEENDVIKTKQLKTDQSIAKSEATSFAAREPRILVPAMHTGKCQFCKGKCALRSDLTLAGISVAILTQQSQCLVKGGSASGRAVNSAVDLLLEGYKRHFGTENYFKAYIARQLLDKASSMDNVIEHCEKVKNLLSPATNPEMVKDYEILAQAHYLLGCAGLDSYFTVPPVVEPEEPEKPVKSSLMDQLCNDDFNDCLQLKMQQVSHEMKSVNEKPISKNGRRVRRRDKIPDSDSAEDEVIVNPLSQIENTDLLKTPSTRISEVPVVRKPIRRMRNTRLNLDTDDTQSPLLTTQKKEKPKADLVTSSASVECVKLKPKSKARSKSPVEIAANTPNADDSIVIDSPASVMSEELNDLFDALEITDENKSTKSIDKDQSKSSDENKTKPVSKSKRGAKSKSTSRVAQNNDAVIDASTKPKAKAPSRAPKTKTATQKPTQPQTSTRGTRMTRSRVSDVENERFGCQSPEVFVYETDDLLRGFRSTRLSTTEEDTLPTDTVLVSPKSPNTEYGTKCHPIVVNETDLECTLPRIETLRGPDKGSAKPRRTKKVSDEAHRIHTNGAGDKKSRKKEKKPVSSEFSIFTDQDMCRTHLEEALKLLQHYPMTSLYRRVCLALGVVTSSTDPWLAAYYFNEATYVSYRHEALMSIRRKRVQKLDYGDTEALEKSVEASLQFPQPPESLRTMLGALPSDWTIVMTSVVKSPETSISHLVVTRLRPNETPLIVQCPGFARHGDSIIESLEETIMDSRMRNTDCEDRIRWWTAKRMYSKSIQDTIDKLENDVFGCWKGILLGRYGNSHMTDAVKEMAKTLVSKVKSVSEREVQLLELLLDSAVYLNTTQIKQCLTEIFPKLARDEIDKIQAEVNGFKSQYPMNGARDSVILMLDKEMTNLPVDNLPILSSHAVLRSLSVYSLHTQHLVSKHRQNQLMITGPDMDNISYILDPDHNLPHTRKTFADWFSELGWAGCVGVRPSRQQIESNLTSSDMMIYLGHGSGQKYYDGSKLQKLVCRAAVVLMGCSSGVLKSNGQLDPHGMVLHYLLARSPFIMGNLWDITDGEIDRFTRALLEYWLSAEPGSKLHTAMQSARDACRLRYLTGCAPVIYGLPL